MTMVDKGISWMKIYRVGLLSVFLLTSGIFCRGEWVLLDNFQEYTAGQSLAATNNWAVGTPVTQATVIPDNLEGGNQAIKIVRNNIESGQHDIFYQNGGAVNIQPGQTGTVFCRFMVESGLDSTLGNTVGEIQPINLALALTDAALLTAGNRRVEITINGGASGTAAWGGKARVSGSLTIERNRWYSLWIVVNNNPEQYGDSLAYLLEDGAEGTPVPIPGCVILPDSKPEILSVFGLIKNRMNGLTDVWVDDFYVDNSGENLTDPTKSASAVGWRERLAQEAAQYREFTKKADTWEQAEQQAKVLLAAMTPSERVALVTGDGWLGISSFARLGIPSVNFSDASAGINNHPAPVKQRHEKTVSYPSLSVLAATWNMELAELYGRSIGEECRSGGTHVLLGPSVNFYRVATCGRNWEYPGEDPFLSSRVTGGYVRGLQSTGTAATLKVIAGNEIEFHRRGSNSRIDERTLNEVYLEPFRAGIEAGALAVMTAYNQLNDEWAGESYYVNTTLLRDTLGFKGISMTDWNGTQDGVKLAASGTDLEMPAGWALKKDREKVIGTSDVDRMALRILKTCIYAGFYDPNYRLPGLEQTRPQWETAALKVNHEGIVLLKNEGVLPLSSSAYVGRKILVSGNNAEREELSGSGSGHVKGYDLKSYVQAVQETFAGADVVSEANPSDELVKTAHLVFLFPGFPLTGDNREGEGSDRSFVLPDDALVARCVDLNPGKTVVCITAGGGVQMDWADHATVILHGQYGGQKGADAMMDILTGKVNPSGKLPFTIEYKLSDSPGFNATAPVPDKSRPYDPKKFSSSFEKQFFYNKDKTEAYVYNIDYQEGVFVGYRWYDEKKLPVRFPFGFGLSYTTFDYSDFKLVKGVENSVSVQFKLTNTGDRDGAETAQVYVGDVQSSVPRPEKELKGFSKVFLKKGESKTVVIELSKKDFEFWSPEEKGWVFEPGEFDIMVGSSSRDIKFSLLSDTCALSSERAQAGPDHPVSRQEVKAPAAVWPTEVKGITYQSAADNTQQHCLVYDPHQDRSVPLLVALHTWSNDYRQPQPFYAQWCIQQGWAMIHPDFRGPNRTPDGCGSELAVQDVLSCVDEAQKTMNIDPDRIYLVGVSGGGHMALLLAGRAPERWAAVSAWCGIYDLAAWHQQTKAAGRPYGQMLEVVCGGAPGTSEVVDSEYRLRSPASWLKKAVGLPLDIAAGISDGHSGSVPVSHSLHAYNKLATETDRIPESEIVALAAEPRVPEELQRQLDDWLYGDNAPVYRRVSGQVRVTLFKGGHQLLSNAALTWLAGQRKGAPANWNPEPVSGSDEGLEPVESGK